MLTAASLGLTVSLPAGAVTLVGNGRPNTLKGKGGNDTGDGNDHIDVGDDVVHLGEGKDIVFGEEGSNTVSVPADGVRDEIVETQ